MNIVPTAAVQRNNDQAYVYVVDTQKSTIQSRNITVATTDGETAAITGVNPGETLVTDGFDRLTDGVKVRVKKDGNRNSDGSTGAGA